MFSRLFVAWSLKRESKVSVKHVSVKRISVKHISVKHVSVKQVSLKQQITTRTTPCSLDSQNMFSGYSSSIATIFACLDSLYSTYHRPRPRIDGASSKRMRSQTRSHAGIIISSTEKFRRVSLLDFWFLSSRLHRISGGAFIFVRTIGEN